MWRMAFEIIPTDRPPPDLRRQYFGSLGEPQVHYLEQRVARGSVYAIGRADSPLGYMVIHDGAVVEFFVLNAALPSLSELFYEAASQGGATSAVIKSYDPLALAATAGRPTRMTTIGINCTSWSDEQFEPPAGFEARPGQSDDVLLLEGIGPGLWERHEEMSLDLRAGRIIVYEQNGAPVGCGVLSPVNEGAAVLDVGVGVLPAWRRKGMAEQIVRHLKLVCLRERRMRPVCGCAVENNASRRTLERAGFLSRHRLLEMIWE
jgi:hypothetical protein